MSLKDFQTILFPETRNGKLGYYRKPVAGLPDGQVVLADFTRSGPSTVIRGGQLVQLSANDPDWSESTKGGCARLLLRPELTNSFKYSEPATDPGIGTRLNVSFAANDWGVGLEGKVIFSDNTVSRRYANVDSLPAGDYTLCFLAKRTDAGVLVYGGGGTGADITTIAAGSSSVSNAKTTFWKDDIFLCQGQVTTGSSSTLFGPNKSTGESANAVEVSAIMVLPGHHVLDVDDYIKTAASAQTRGLGSYELPTLNLLSNSISFLQQIRWEDNGSDFDILRFQNSSNVDQITLRAKTGGNLVLAYLDGTLTELGVGLPSGQDGVLGFTYDGSILKLYLNGGLDSSIALSGLSQITKIVANPNVNKFDHQAVAYSLISPLTVSESDMKAASDGILKTYLIPSEFDSFFSNTVQRNAGGVYTTDYGFNSIPSSISGNICYIDPVSGNDGNSGTEASPFETIDFAVTQNFNILRLKAGTVFKYDQSAFGSIGKNLKIERYGVGADPIVSTAIDLTFTAHPTLANVYETTNPETSIDIGSVSDAADLDDFGRPTGLSEQLGATAVRNTPGSFYYSTVSKSLFIRTFDDRAPDADVLCYLNQNILEGKETLSTEDIFIHAKNIDFRGGEPVEISQFGAFSYRFGFDSCHFDYTGIKDGFFISGTYNGYLKDCISNYLKGDGFNYRSTTTGFAFEFNCTSWYSFGSISNNGSTCHDSGVVIRVGGNYQYHSGKALQDIENTKSLNIGIVAGNGTGVAPQNIPFASDSTEAGATKMWLYDCKTVDDFSVAAFWNFDTSIMNIGDGVAGNLLEVGRPNVQGAGSTLNVITDIYED